MAKGEIMATRGKGEGSIYKRSDGMWCASVDLPKGLDGKRRRKVICRKDKAMVVKLMREAQAQVAKHGNIATSSTTLEKWMRHWIDDIAALKLRPKTLAGHRTVMDNYIIPILGSKRLEKLTAADVRKLHMAMQSTPKDLTLRGETDLPPGTEMLSSTYARLAHNVLSGSLKVALREGRITANPCDLVDKPTARITEQKALDVPEAIKLLKHLATRQDRALWATYLLTGARRGEILGLEADRVTDELDLSWQLQRITDISKAPQDWEHRHLRSTLYLSRPKSKAGWRVVPLVEPLKSILALHVGNQREGLVFTRNGEPWDPDAATKAWASLLIEAGLPDDVVLHGSRHTAVDLLYEAGVPEQVIMEIVGHTTRAVTRGYKTKGNRKQLTDAMDKMSKLLEA
jgi:integrase